MKERPILFSAPMVRAILDCTKTQTRRMIKNKPDTGRPAQCRYGKPGDLLWVRESWSKRTDGTIVYAADEIAEKVYWKPAMFMNRWASRITLEVTGVRVERLLDISESDAIAEGVHPDPCERQDDDGDGFFRIGAVRGDSFPIARYAVLWESINGTGSWESNPWVWVIEFTKVK